MSPRPDRRPPTAFHAFLAVVLVGAGVLGAPATLIVKLAPGPWDWPAAGAFVIAAAGFIAVQVLRHRRSAVPSRKPGPQA